MSNNIARRLLNIVSLPSPWSGGRCGVTGRLAPPPHAPVSAHLVDKSRPERPLSILLLLIPLIRERSLATTPRRINGLTDGPEPRSRPVPRARSRFTSAPASLMRQNRLAHAWIGCLVTWVTTQSSTQPQHTRIHSALFIDGPRSRGGTSTVLACDLHRPSTGIGGV